MFIVAHCQKCDAATEQDGNVENDICFRHFFERCCVQAVQSTMEYHESSHHPNGLPVCGHITVEVACH